MAKTSDFVAIVQTPFFEGKTLMSEGYGYIGFSVNVGVDPRKSFSRRFPGYKVIDIVPAKRWIGIILE